MSNIILETAKILDPDAFDTSWYPEGPESEWNVVPMKRFEQCLERQRIAEAKAEELAEAGLLNDEANVVQTEDTAAFTVDSEANAAYVTVTKQPIDRTVEYDGQVFVDLDEDSAPVGFEFLGRFVN